MKCKMNNNTYNNFLQHMYMFRILMPYLGRKTVFTNVTTRWR